MPRSSIINLFDKALAAAVPHGSSSSLNTGLSKTRRLSFAMYMQRILIIFFPMVSENGCEIDGVDDKSELAHCIMLVNFLRTRHR